MLQPFEITWSGIVQVSGNSKAAPLRGKQNKRPLNFMFIILKKIKANYFKKKMQNKIKLAFYVLKFGRCVY